MNRKWSLLAALLVGGSLLTGCAVDIETGAEDIVLDDDFDSEAGLETELAEEHQGQFEAEEQTAQEFVRAVAEAAETPIGKEIDVEGAAELPTGIKTVSGPLSELVYGQNNDGHDGTSEREGPDPQPWHGHPGPDPQPWEHAKENTENGPDPQPW